MPGEAALPSNSLERMQPGRDSMYDVDGLRRPARSCWAETRGLLAK
jgi:hypothetical protein